MVEFKLIPNKDYKLREVRMDTNAELADNLIEPLDSIKSGALILISGGPNSGKSTLLINILSNKKIKGSNKKQSLLGCFHNMYVCSPTLSSISDKDNIFNHDDIHKFSKFDKEFLDFLESEIEQQKSEHVKGEEKEKNCIILDDVADQLKKKETIEAFNHLCIARRHLNATIFVISQKYKMIPTACRECASQTIIFRPNEISEEECVYEMFKLPKRDMAKTLDYFFDKPHSFVFIDKSTGGKRKFYKKFDRVEF